MQSEARVDVSRDGVGGGEVGDFNRELCQQSPKLQWSLGFIKAIHEIKKDRK